MCSCAGWTDSSEEAVVLSGQKCLCSWSVSPTQPVSPLRVILELPTALPGASGKIEPHIALMYRCLRLSNASFWKMCSSQSWHLSEFLWFAAAGTLHQRGTALPGSSGKHAGRHSLRGRRPAQQLPSAHQLWEVDQHEADDVAFLSSENIQAPKSLFTVRELIDNVSPPLLQNESIVNRATGRCLEVVPAKVYFGHLLILQPCTGQRWTIKNTMKQ